MLLTAGDDHVVAVDDFVVGAVAEDRGDLAGLQALDPADFVGAVVGQAAGELGAVGVAQADHVALVETGPRRSTTPIGQQAAALLLDGRAGAGVEDQMAARLDGEADPAFARGDGLALGQEQRADRLAGEDLAAARRACGRWR